MAASRVIRGRARPTHCIQVEVEGVVECRLFEIRKYADNPAPPCGLVKGQNVVGRTTQTLIRKLRFVDSISRRKFLIGLFIIEQSNAQLAQIIKAVRSSSAGPRRLHRGQEQSDQDADNRYDYQQLDKRKSTDLPRDSATRRRASCDPHIQHFNGLTLRIQVSI